jgi:hypothetical protein
MKTKIETQENFKNIIIKGVEDIQHWRVEQNERGKNGIYLRFFGHELTPAGESENIGFANDDTMMHFQLTLKEAIMLRDRMSVHIEKLLLKMLEKRGV